MSRALFDTALTEVRSFHAASRALSGFCALPDNPSFKKPSPRFTPASRLFADDEGLASGPFEAARAALAALVDLVEWRAPYRDHPLASTFMERFCVFELIGLEAAFRSGDTRGFVVYAAPHLYYPWHHHPAEEIYFVIAGEALFATEDGEPRLLQPGDTTFHASNQPHNMETKDSGVLAFVQWRGDLMTPPVFTDRLNA